MSTLPPIGSRLFRNTGLLAAVLVVGIAGCHKKVVSLPPPPPPAPTNTPGPATGPAATTRPVATLTVEPSRIERGQSATLTWTVTGASDISINNGVGTVAARGNVAVNPLNTTTYTLTANGAGGSTTALATLTVTAGAPPPGAPPVVSSTRGTLESRLQSDIQDALFDYDAVNIRDDARQALTRDASALKLIFADFPGATVNVEGHCDERGSAEYNLGLGDRRATAAKDILVGLGIPADKLRTISYGKERPQCTESEETCWQKNRRAHLSAGQ